MTLSIDPQATTKDLVNLALDFSKYGNDIEAILFIDEVLEELNYKMRANEFSTFKSRIINNLIESK